MLKLNSFVQNRFSRIRHIKLPALIRNEFLQIGLISILILLFTFPDFSPTISVGLDGSYVYAFNYFFAHRIPLGIHHIFTYGPLVFIFAPGLVGHNFAIAIVATCLIRLYFIYSFLLLGWRANPPYRVLHIILIVGLCNFLCLDMVLAGGALLAILHYHFRNHKMWLISVSVLAALAFLIKTSFGALCFAPLFSYALYSLFLTKRPYILVFLSIVISFFILLIWFLVYHSILTLPGYIYTNVLEVREYANSLQLEDAVNHWGVFCLGIVCFFIPMLFAKNKLTAILYIICLFPLYITFKYSFVREDVWHEAIIWNYIIMLCAIVLLIESNFKRIALLMQLASVALLYMSMILTGDFSDVTMPITGINKFVTWVIHYNSSVKNAELTDSHTLQCRILDAKQRNIIGNSTVDCYPFEYTYVVANNLNWSPRPNLQLYISTPYIDSVNAAFLTSPKAPRFYIWQHEQPPEKNVYCDNRYILNEDPQSTYTFFNYYRLKNDSNTVALFKRMPHNLMSKEKIMGTEMGELGSWLYVPPCDSNSIIRARLHFSNTVKGTLRKIFYKDQIYFADYMLSSGQIITYRFIPLNATTGLWVNPLILDMSKGLMGKQVKAVRIRASRKGCIENRFGIEWTTFHPLAP